jgi:biopolymer transport protein ExbD
MSLLAFAGTSVTASAQPADWPELTLPSGSAQSDLEDGIVIAVATDGVYVDLEQAIELRAGEVPDSARQSNWSPILPELRSVVERAINRRLRLAVLRGEGHLRRVSAIVAADHRIPYETLGCVMMTASSAGVGELHIAVRSSLPPDLWSANTDAESGALRLLSLYAPEVGQPDRPEPPAHGSRFGRELGVGDLQTGESLLPDHDGPLLDQPSERSETQPVAPPRLVLTISRDGVGIADLARSEAFAQSGLGDPVEGCPATSPTPVTICVPTDRAERERLIDRLDYRRLYNRLVAIADYPAWSSEWAGEPRVVSVTADADVPLEVVVRVIGVARQRLERDRYEADDAFYTAQLRTPAEPLFQRSSLLMPRRSRP